MRKREGERERGKIWGREEEKQTPTEREISLQVDLPSKAHLTALRVDMPGLRKLMGWEAVSVPLVASQPRVFLGRPGAGPSAGQRQGQPGRSRREHRGCMIDLATRYRAQRMRQNVQP